MAVTMADITKLRKMSGAGMMDCKKALTETVMLLKVVYWQRKMANLLLSLL